LSEGVLISDKGGMLSVYAASVGVGSDALSLG